MSTPLPTETKVYRVWYDDARGFRRCVEVPRDKGMASLKEGVFIDADGLYAAGIDWNAWIPPSRFVVVTLETIRE